MVRFIILVIILILALSYFGISIREIAESPTGEDNLSFVWARVMEGWDLLVVFLSNAIENIGSVFK